MAAAALVSCLKKLEISGGMGMLFDLAKKLTGMISFLVYNIDGQNSLRGDPARRSR